MSVKLDTVLFRNLLYVREIVCSGSIRSAAERNNIKPSNLSKIITDTEDLFHMPLFQRTSHGLLPSKNALELSHEIEKMLQNLLALKAKFLNSQSIKSLRLYVSKGLEIDDVSCFSGQVTCVDEPEYADVIVSVEKPQKASKMVCVEHKIGSGVKQTVWVCAQNNPQAMDLATFILLKFRD